MNAVFRYVLLAVGLLLIGVLIGLNLRNPAQLSAGESLSKLEQAIAYLEDNYVKEVKHEQLVDDAITGILNGLDPHSFYLSREEMTSVNEEMEGSFSGIGVEFSILEDTVYVVTPIAGGPSERMGILAGDRIVQVDDKTIAGIGIKNGDVPKYLKGKKGSKVKIGIRRAGSKDLLTFEIVRDDIPLFSVNHSYMIRPGVGYIPVTRFAEKTYDEFHDALVKLKAQGMKSLILDLRGNPGGFLNRACEIADEFLPGGRMIVSTKGRIRESNHSYESTMKGDFENGSLVILIDYGSASASEIVSGAVQDHDRGLIVGVRSFGKGLVQTQKEFEDGSAMRVVVSEYYTPSGRCIQKPYNKTHEAYEHEIEERFEKGEMYDPSKVEFPDSLKYQTASGRTVYGGGGIFPDVFIPTDTTGASHYFGKLVGKDMFRAFAYQYVDAHKAQTAFQSPAQVLAFNITPAIMQEFKAYAAAHGVPMDEAGFRRSEKLIANRIKAYMGRRVLGDDGFFPVFHEEDKVLQQAISLLPKAEQLAKTGKI